MKRVIQTCILLGVLPAMAAPAAALASAHRTPRAATVNSTFRLQAAHVPAGTTFWVAYGPLNGVFSIRRLQSTPGGIFQTHLALPRGAQGDFYYIEGHGQMKTRLGWVPGNPVRTVGHVGPLVVGQSSIPTVTWHRPMG